MYIYMYICIYIYIVCIYIYIHIYICIYICIYIYDMYICHVIVYVYIYIHTCMILYIYIYLSNIVRQRTGVGGQRRKRPLPPMPKLRRRNRTQGPPGAPSRRRESGAQSGNTSERCPGKVWNVYLDILYIFIYIDKCRYTICIYIDIYILYIFIHLESYLRQSKCIYIYTYTYYMLYCFFERKLITHDVAA